MDEWRLHRPKAEVVVEIDGNRVGCTKIATKGWEAVWNEDIYIDVVRETKVVVKVYDHRGKTHGNAALLGKADVDYTCVFASPPRTEYITLKVKKTNTTLGRVCIYLDPLECHNESATDKDSSSIISMDEVVQKAEAKISAEPSYERFKDALTWMNVVLKVTEPLSEIGLPGLKTAHDILSSVYEVLNSQKERDENVGSLGQEVAQLWAILSEIRDLNMMRTMRDIIEAATKQTLECAKFLSRYADSGIATRFFTGYFVTDERISAFQESFRDLRERLTRGASMQTWVTVERRYADMQDRMDLQGLTEAHGATFNEGRVCLAKTRQSALDRILCWVEDKSACGVYWLTGVAGCGKSTIAHTVAKVLNDNHRLGASFFFDRNDASLNNARLFCTTIASQLARYDPALRQAIVDAIKQDPGIDAKPPPNQMGPLISATTKKVHFTVPLVIVIDAIDESGTPDSRKEFMTMLRRELLTLSAQVKVLITSRDEADILSALPTDASHHPHRADVKGETQADIRLYIQSQLSDIAMRFPHLKDWPSTKDIDLLARRADGLFIWARVACDFILHGPHHDPPTHLEMIKSINPAERALAESSLDALYLTVLRETTSVDDHTAKSSFRYVVGSIITLKDPLSPIDLDHLLGLEMKNIRQPIVLADGQAIRLTSSQGWIMSLAGVLSNEGPDKPIRMIHPSIFDFFVSANRSREFCVDVQLAHRLLTNRCMTRMDILLRHDICALRDPSKVNREISDIDDRVERCIPGDLKYACRFWGFHLIQIEDAEASLASIVMEFLNRHFLHWLEVMSLLGRAGDVGILLQAVHKWSKNQHLERLAPLAQDCFRFAQQFRPIMDVSAMHIYISATVFCPRGSAIFEALQDHCPGPLPIISSGEDALTAAVCCIHEGHLDDIYAIAFLPDVDQVVSAGADSMIRVWEHTSGCLVQEPLRDHDDTVSALTVTSDGSMIASGSYDKTVRLWRASTGQSIGEPLSVSESIVGVVFLSHNTLLMACCTDGSIWIWDVQTRAVAKMARIECNGEVECIAVSPSGELLASTSCSFTRTWSLSNWTPVGDALDAGYAVTFSPDSTHLAFASQRGSSAVVCNLSTMHVIHLDGHDDCVNAVAFSPDGQLLASGSSDNTVRLWNATSGQALCTLFGHSNSIFALAFSADSTQLASASADRTVRAWDVQYALSSISAQPESNTDYVACIACSPNSQQLAFAVNDVVYISAPNSSTTPLRKHRENVQFLTFSSDGMRLVSISNDLLQWWDTQTGSTLDGVPLHGLGENSLFAMSPDYTKFAVVKDDRAIQLRSATSGEPIGEALADHEDEVKCIEFSPDGLWLATGAMDYTIRLRDPNSGAEVGDSIEVDNPSTVAFSPDSKQLASASLDGSAQLWNVSSRELIWEYSEGITGAIFSMIFTTDGRQLMAGSEDGAVVVLDVSLGTQVCKPIRRFNSCIEGLALLHGGTDLVVAANTIQIWEKGENDAWIFKQEIYPPSKMFWRKKYQPSGPFLSSLRESPRGWLTTDNGQKLLWIPEHLRCIWSPFESSRLRLGRDSPQVTLDLRDYLTWLSGISGVPYEADEEWSYRPADRSIDPDESDDTGGDSDTSGGDDTESTSDAGEESGSGEENNIAEDSDASGEDRDSKEGGSYGHAATGADRLDQSA
ncbi:WD40 repeat-like protein [Obba rivulosa]|uniref:WD40 repeat-like protein n=1 Tax=Obba rivulosa TaxID=1052685 RepID=A0A8E2DJ95_9APHY|nr:WD40 repeat-like protein [Obba rivulosa]